MKNHLSSLNKIVRQWLIALRRWLLLLMMLVILVGVALPLTAEAKDYNFPGKLPDGCSANAVPNTYDCGTLTLANGDTVTITAKPGNNKGEQDDDENKGDDKKGEDDKDDEENDDTVTTTTKLTTINFSGVFTTGNETLINSGGNPADLNINLNAVLNVGLNTHVIANVTTKAKVNLADNSQVAGSITATTTPGIIITGNKTTVGGAINAEIGAVTIGPNSTVNGTITAPVGVVTIGANSHVNGDINGGKGAVNIGSGVKLLTGTSIPGNITTAAGVVTLGSSNTVGNITTAAGGVTLGSSNTAGNITTAAGVVTLGSSNTGGNITTAAGGVTLGSSNTVGNITTVAGVVTLGPDNKAGNITTDAGAITVGDDSIIGTVVSTVGVITILKNVTINGDITSGAGAINIESKSHLCGSVSVTGAGVITLTTDVKVGGSINSIAGAVTVSNGSTVNGHVIITGVGVLTMTSVQVGGNIATVAGAITLTNSRVGGTVKILGAGVKTLTNSTQEDATLFIPPACGVAPTPGTPISGSTATGLFDCLETGKQNPSLYTKLAGTAFTFDIAALKTDKTLNSNYVGVGGTSKTVRVELFDDTTSPANCATYANPVAVAQKAIFTSSSGGRTLTGAFNLPGVYKKLRCRVTECTDSSCASSATAEQSCSSDQFSVRPVAVTLASSDAGATGIAPLATSTQIIKAGADFNLSATTGNDNYSGVLTLDTGKLTVENPNQDTTLPNNGVQGTLTSSLTANAAISNATYSEVGYVYLALDAYRDDEFTKLDSINGDCIANSFSNALDANGKYGCSIGTNALILGRFIPHHFGVTGSLVTRSDLPITGSQVISPFTYMDEPMQLALTVTAYNKSEGFTHNYQGKFAKLNTTGWNLPNWNCSGISNVQCMGLSATNGTTNGTTSLTDRLAIDTTSRNSKVASNTTISGGIIDGWSNGSSYFSVNILLARYVNPDIVTNPYGKGVIPDGPFDALKLGVKPQDSDGVTLPPKAATDLAHCVNLNTKTSSEDSNCTFAAADETDLRRKIVETKIRFGRLSLKNAYGSEFQDLPIPVEVQYWNGSSFVTNSDDNNTHLVDGNIIIGNFEGALVSMITPPIFYTADINGSCSANSVSNGVVSNGKSCILLAAPSISGSFDLLLNLASEGSPANCLTPVLASDKVNSAKMAYLRSNWCGTAYDRDPSASAMFGIYSGNNEGRSSLIYFREVF